MILILNTFVLGLKASNFEQPAFPAEEKSTIHFCSCCDLQSGLKNHTLVSLPTMTLAQPITDVRSLNSKGPYECTPTPDELITALNIENIPKWKPQPSLWKPLCHPRVDEVSLEVDGYFLHHWNFSSEKAAKVYLDAAFSRVTCLYFPLAKDDRIHFACRLLTVLFLIDGKRYPASSIFSLANIKIKRNWG